MKKILALILVSILLFTGLNAVAYAKDETKYQTTELMTFSDPIISQKNGFSIISIKESEVSLSAEGKPIVPAVSKLLTFPFGTSLDDITITTGKTQQIQINNKLQPSPQIGYISTEFTAQQNDDVIDYSSFDTYPIEQFSYKYGAGMYNGEHVMILNVQIYPVQYRPNTNTLTYFNNAKIVVDYTIPSEPLLTEDEFDFLILTPTEFADELQPLVDYKNNDGIATILKTLDEIPETGVDQPESIKYFIKDAIEEWGIDYVMLVGSWVEKPGGQPDSTFAKFPIRKAYIPSGSYETWFPSDLYYADIYDAETNFSTWDDNGNGKFAEITSTTSDIPAMDLYPDVALGRIPCTTATEVTDMVEKIILFEEHNKMTQKIVQIGGDTFPGDEENINEGEFANKEVMENLPAYEAIRYWASQSDGAKKLSKRNIANGFNQNVDFVDFSGHGSYASWATHAPNDDDTWLPAKTLFSPYRGWLYIDYEIYQVNNKEKHPVVVFDACSCSKFSESEKCMSWTSIKGDSGGIASYGASGIGYGSYGSSQTERVWGWMEVNIFKELYNDKVLGDVWYDCLNGYTNNFISNESYSSDYKTIVEMTLFGDPTLAIENGKDPKSHEIKPFTIMDQFNHFFDLYTLEEMIKNIKIYLNE